jgi:hypothetical protein
MGRTCVFCGQAIAGERGTGMNARSARRLLGTAPPPALAVADDAGNQRWFGHAGCAGEAGARRRPPSRAERLDALLARPIPDTREGVARFLAKLALLDHTGYDALTEEQIDRHSDLSYVDNLLATGTEPEPELRARVRVREIGHHLNELGGRPLMIDVLHLAEELSRQRILRAVEMCWDEIGDWRG